MTIEHVADEIKSRLTEGVFQSRWGLIETYHDIGRIMAETIAEEKISANELVQGLGQYIERGRSTLHYALQFYKKFPDLNQLPDGKNASWNKVILMLSGGNAEKKAEHTDLRDVLMDLATDEVRENPSLPYASTQPLSVIIASIRRHE